MKQFTIHDIFYEEIFSDHISREEYIEAVKRAMEQQLKLYVTCPLPDKLLEVDPGCIVGRVISFDPGTFTYECECEQTPAGQMIDSWTDATHFTGHPVFVFGIDITTVTQIALVHEYEEPCI